MQELKTAISEEIGWQVLHQRLIYDGRVVEDGRALLHYNIQTGAVIDLRLQIPDPVQISIRMAGATESIALSDLGASDTIAFVKHKIQSKKGISPDLQLKDDFTLADYNIPKKCTLHCGFVLNVKNEISGLKCLTY